MDVVVTRHASTECDRSVRHLARRCMWLCGVTCLDVARLAEPRLGQLQHHFVIAAVGAMAVRAALHRGRMLPEERTAFVRVAFIADVVERVGLEEAVGHGPVGVVATRAVHLAFADRHVREVHLLGTLAEMALPTDLYHRGLGETGADGDVLHDHVAVRARQTAIVVRAPLPEQAGLSLVTAEADRVLLLHGRGVILGKGNHAPDAFAAPRIHVGFARAVAVLARVPLPRVSWVLEEQAPHPRLGERMDRILMATLARLGADVARVGQGPLDGSQRGGCGRRNERRTGGEEK